MNKGLVHLYFGDGKGKTTAAIGLGIRACGRGKKILLVQFLKGNDSGEILFLESNNAFKILKDKPVKKFINYMSEDEKAEVFICQKQLFQSALQEIKNGAFDLVIFDEIIDSINLEIISLRDLRDFLRTRPLNLEVVMTGHSPKEELFALCDYVTENKKIKHPYDEGIHGRIGIEK